LNDSVPLNRTPVFTKEFCHPPVGANMTVENWEKCPTDADRWNCPSQCAFDNGAEFIPEHDFCSVKNITNNATAIVDCAGADKESCGQWPRY
jgi:hypothetical protein